MGKITEEFYFLYITYILNLTKFYGVFFRMLNILNSRSWCLSSGGAQCHFCADCFSSLCACVWKELKEQYQLVPLFLSVNFSHLKPKGSKGRHRSREQSLMFSSWHCSCMRYTHSSFVLCKFLSPPFAWAFNNGTILKMPSLWAICGLCARRPRRHCASILSIHHIKLRLNVFGQLVSVCTFFLTQRKLPWWKKYP